MRKVIITGFALAISPHVTGVQRACRELLLRLDNLLADESMEAEYVYPAGAPNAVIAPEEFRHIKPVAIKKPWWAWKYLKKFWLDYRLNRDAKKEGAIGCCLAYEWPFGTRNVSYLHDIRPAVTKFDSFGFRARFQFFLKKCRRGCTLALTDSDYQAALIREYFSWKPERVETVYLGWEHVKEIAPDDGVFEKFPALGNGGYFYTLGSLAPHKNFKWMMEVAKRNPDKLFVIAGGKDLKIWKDDVEDDSFPNVLFPGRVTDGENRALMERCRAFLFPSKFEGFGIPPLEALACGAAVACSSATCLPEIYEDCVHYFDPDDYNVDLDGLLAQPVAPPDKLLAKYSWDKAAEQLLNALKTEGNR